MEVCRSGALAANFGYRIRGGGAAPTEHRVLFQLNTCPAAVRANPARQTCRTGHFDL